METLIPICGCLIIYPMLWVAAYIALSRWLPVLGKARKLVQEERRQPIGGYKR